MDYVQEEKWEKEMLFSHRVCLRLVACGWKFIYAAQCEVVYSDAGLLSAASSVCHIRASREFVSVWRYFGECVSRISWFAERA